MPLCMTFLIIQRIISGSTVIYGTLKFPLLVKDGGKKFFYQRFYLDNSQYKNSV